jgi:hypothetical protein
MFDSAACSCAEPYHSRGWKLNLRIKPAFRPAFSRWRGNFFAVRLFVIDEGAEAGCALDVREAAIAAARDRGYCAYTIALSSLIGSVGSARAAAEAAAPAGGILCHVNVAGQSAPSTDETNDRICADCCCVGCLTLTAGMPSPSAKVVAVPRSPSHCIALPAITVLAGGPAAKSHQSRAPPRVA